MFFGTPASVYFAFALLSTYGLKSPLKFSPNLMPQLVYEVTWFVTFIIPMLVSGTFSIYTILLVVITASYIIGDLIAIPFPYIFAKEVR